MCPRAIWKTRQVRPPRLNAPIRANNGRDVCYRHEAGQLDGEPWEQLHVTVVQSGQGAPEREGGRLGVENPPVLGPDCLYGGHARLAQQGRRANGGKAAQITKCEHPGRQVAPRRHREQRSPPWHTGDGFSPRRRGK